MLSKFIHEGRLATTNPTFIALPSLTSHSTFYECSRGILCQPQESPHSPLTRMGVIFFLYTWKERSHYHRRPLFRPMFTPSQVTKQYDAYTASRAQKTTSAIH